MSQRIWIGRAGDAEYPFTLPDIMRGAVRESGLFPELYQSPWPAITAGVSVTGVQRKFHEQVRAIGIGGFNTRLFLPPEIWPRAQEDSKEKEKNQSQIAKGKAETGFIKPFTNHLVTLPPQERDTFLYDILQRTGLNDPRQVFAFSDDRNSIMDAAFRDPLYGSLRRHYNEQVREIFGAEHLVPGKRVKEADSALYGVLNAIYLREKAIDELRSSRIVFDEKHRMDTTLWLASVMPGLLPLPESGLIVRAEGAPMGMRRISDRDLQDLKYARIFTYDDFNMVYHDDFPNGMVLAELKRKHPDHPYFTENFSPGLALNAFASAVGIPKAETGEPFLRRIFKGAASDKTPKTVVSSLSLISAPLNLSERKGNLTLPRGMKFSGAQGPFETLYQLEQSLHSGQAFVVEDPDKVAVPKDHNIRDKNGALISDDSVRKLRLAQTDLIFAYLITMSTQAGSPNHFGRSHMVDAAYAKKRGMWHPDMCTMGLTGDVESEAYRLFSNKTELGRGLAEWDRSVYRHVVPIPANDFIKSQAQFEKIVGLSGRTLNISVYGTASSFMAQAHDDPREITYRLSRQKNTVVFHGGGSMGAMLGAYEGGIQAKKEGFEIRQVAIRSETDVSPLEGSIEKFVSTLGDNLDQNETSDPRHFHFAEGQISVLKMNRLLQRQHPIAAMSDVAVFVPGGKGTVVEFAIIALHNTMVRILGQGLFPGYSANERIIPMLFSNHEFDYLGKRRAVFDVLLEPYREDFDFLGIHDFRSEDRIDRIMEYIDDHAAGLGVDITPQISLGPDISWADPSM